MERKVIKKLNRYSWRELNKKDVGRITKEFNRKVLNSEKLRKRRVQMIKNIKKRSIKRGKILILTGVGHLKFLKKNLEGATILLRQTRRL